MYHNQDDICISAELVGLLDSPIELDLKVEQFNNECESCQILIWPANNAELAEIIKTFSEDFFEQNAVFIPSNGNRFWNKDIMELPLTLASRLYTFSIDKGKVYFKHSASCPSHNLVLTP